MSFSRRNIFLGINIFVVFSASFLFWSNPNSALAVDYTADQCRAIGGAFSSSATNCIDIDPGYFSVGNYLNVGCTVTGVCCAASAIPPTGGACTPPAPAPSTTTTTSTSSSSPDCTATPKPASCVGTPAPGNSTTIPFDNPLKFDTVEGVLGSLLGALRGIIVVLALIAIVIGAILYITSTGNDSRMTLAKGAITAAMIGLAIGIAAPSFLLQIGDILGWGPVTNSLPPETRTLTAIALSVLQFLLSIVGVLAIIMLVVGGIMYMTAAGNEDRIDTGKKIVTYSIIGIAVALAALVIVTQIAVLFA